MVELLLAVLLVADQPKEDQKPILTLGGTEAISGTITINQGPPPVTITLPATVCLRKDLTIVPGACPEKKQ